MSSSPSVSTSFSVNEKISGDNDKSLPEASRVSPLSPPCVSSSAGSPRSQSEITSKSPDTKDNPLQWLEGTELPPSPTIAAEPSVVRSCSYDANAPSEDRYASIVDLELRKGGTLFNCSLFCVLDGHGGSNVAAFASENLLPTVIEDLASTLSATIHGGSMRINDVPSADWRAKHAASLVLTETDPTKIRPGRHAINYINEADEQDTADDNFYGSAGSYSALINSQSQSQSESPAYSYAQDPPSPDHAGLTPLLRKQISKSVTLSFLNVDKRYINSIDATRVQRGCQSGGAWNAGSCALVTLVLRKPGSTPFLVTAHCGDCRAILGTVRPTSAPVSIAIPHLSQTEEDLNDEELFGAISHHASDSDLPTDKTDSSRKRKRDTPPLHPSAASSTKGSPHLPVGSTSPFVPVSSTSSSTSGSTPCASPPPSPSSSSNWSAVELTNDHNCYNELEVEIVRDRCKTDPRSVSNPSKGGIRRVAGSLAVTRALGDAYLKTPKLSFPPYKLHAPYITAKPEIHIRPIRTEEGNRDVLADKVLVMASDGVWEHALNGTVVEWVQEQIEGRNDCEQDCPAKNIVEGVLDTISVLRKKSRKLLGSLPKGKARRSNHDDITVMVVDLAACVEPKKNIV